MRRYCPAIAELGVTYHWNIDQTEYSTDIIFAHRADLQAIYDRLTRTAIHTWKMSVEKPPSRACGTRRVTGPTRV